ncbi:sigma-E factor negative regulatory protein [Vogesella indigofera]|uniref:sigma-E factor negative regulatory protein n=1 Tax=Vogesella indigofera TaxID=45465 RepID=UPI00234EFF98|nr:sigma-E factor negative regulatory protein [Vogesella indigofera]MDC7706962.1 sigma-E factor negative regulatory protein [Vogesella indigofera]
MKQNLSSLMDGELDDAASTQCIRALDADPELKAAWNEYHLIGDAIRGSALLSVDVRVEVGQALQQEPTVLAPKPKRGSSGLMRYAMAASFALAGVVGWAVWQSQPEPVPGLMAQAVSTPQGGTVQVSAEQASSRNSYLQAHRDMMAAEGLERVNLAEPVSGVAR